MYDNVYGDAFVSSTRQMLSWEATDLGKVL
jgi:hypothetical protein